MDRGSEYVGPGIAACGFDRGGTPGRFSNIELNQRAQRGEFVLAGWSTTPSSASRVRNTTRKLTRAEYCRAPASAGLLEGAREYLSDVDRLKAAIQAHITVKASRNNSRRWMGRPKARLRPTSRRERWLSSSRRAPRTPTSGHSSPLVAHERCRGAAFSSVGVGPGLACCLRCIKSAFSPRLVGRAPRLAEWPLAPSRKRDAARCANSDPCNRNYFLGIAVRHGTVSRPLARSNVAGKP